MISHGICSSRRISLLPNCRQRISACIVEVACRTFSTSTSFFTLCERSMWSAAVRSAIYA